MLSGFRAVDLTQPIRHDTVRWPGEPAPSARLLATLADDGAYAREITIGEHTGTHLDAPCHFVEWAESVDQIGVERLFRPLAVIDIGDEIGGNADAELTLEQVEAFELRHGRIPQGAAVFLRTGWEAFYEDPVRYANEGGDLRFPGYGPEAARFLVEARDVAGLGIDTLGIDPGRSGDHPIHREITLPKGRWHVENLCNLRGLPPLGAWVVVAPLRLTGGSGCPCRVIALVP